MVILKKILNVVCDPFRKGVSHVDTDRVSKFFHRYQYLLYIASFLITLTAFILVYIVAK